MEGREFKIDIKNTENEPLTRAALLLQSLGKDDFPYMDQYSGRTNDEKFSLLLDSLRTIQSDLANQEIPKAYPTCLWMLRGCPSPPALCITCNVLIDLDSLNITLRFLDLPPLEKKKITKITSVGELNAVKQRIGDAIDKMESKGEQLKKVAEKRVQHKQRVQGHIQTVLQDEHSIPPPVGDIVLSYLFGEKKETAGPDVVNTKEPKRRNCCAIS